MRRLALLTIALGGLSCLSSQSHPRRYYTLNVAPIAKPASLRIPGVVRVRNLDTEAAYDRFQIVVRRSPYELEYRETHVWAVKPGQAVSDMLARMLVEMRVFDAVTRDLTEQRPDYVLSGDLHALEVYDSGDIWFAHLAMTLSFSRHRTGERLWTFAFDERKQVASLTFSHAARTMSELLTSALSKALASMATALSSSAQPAPAAQIPGVIVPRAEVGPSTSVEEPILVPETPRE